jgi:hypothetical protein
MVITSGPCLGVTGARLSLDRKRSAVTKSEYILRCMEQVKLTSLRAAQGNSGDRLASSVDMFWKAMKFSS